MHDTSSYFTILCYTALYYIRLYYTVLYHTWNTRPRLLAHSLAQSLARPRLALRGRSLARLLARSPSSLAPSLATRSPLARSLARHWPGGRLARRPSGASRLRRAGGIGGRPRAAAGVKGQRSLVSLKLCRQPHYRERTLTLFAHGDDFGGFSTSGYI